MTQPIILTGDRPTGPLHLGHYVGSLSQRVLLQDTHRQYVMIADAQALTDNFNRPEKIKSSIMDVTLDYLSVGIDPNKTTIFIQSQVTELFEIAMYFMNLVNLGRLSRNPTVKNEMKQKGFEEEIPVGFLCYPISQAADITAFKANFVPVGEDQLPMIELTNEIVRKFNRLYQKEVLVETKALLSKTTRLVGIDGKEKAGKSLGNAIFLTDTKDVVKEKVFSMYTDPNHIKITDPGKVEGNVVFSYLDAFHTNIHELNDLKNHYKKGGLGDVTIKKILLKTLIEFLEPIWEKRKTFNKNDVESILSDGLNQAKPVVNNTLKEIKEAMKIERYF